MARAPDRDADPFWTTAEVAKRYRTFPSTVRYWRHMGTGPAGVLIGRRVLYPESELQRWEQEKGVRDNSDGGGGAA